MTPQENPAGVVEKKVLIGGRVPRKFAQYEPGCTNTVNPFLPVSSARRQF